MIINGYEFNNKISEEKIEWLKINYHLKIEELEKELQLCDETIYKILKALGIERKRLRKLSIPHNEEAKQLLLNPYISHVKIAEKYNCTPEAVAKRRILLGVGVRRNCGMNRLEEKIKIILENLDLAYIYEKRIGTFSIDFYLGLKYCIDVHGTWAHAKDKQIEIDGRKEVFLKDNGFKYLAIHENQIENAEEMLKEFLSGFPLSVMTSKKPGERLVSGVAKAANGERCNANPVPSLSNEEGLETIEK
jgi:very-short-patch-repair endonuclease